MIKAVAIQRKGHVQVRARVRRACGRIELWGEMVSLIVGICDAAQERNPEITPEILLNAAMQTIKNREERRRNVNGEGIALKCYMDADECIDRDPTGWCGRYDRMCEEVHIDLLKEDGEE